MNDRGYIKLRRNGIMEIFVLRSEEVSSITRATHGVPHHILGMHECLDDCFVNAYLPEAVSVSVVDVATGDVHAMEEIYARGFFSLRLQGRKPFAYKLRATYVKWGESGEETVTREMYDAYSFGCSANLAKVMDVVNGNDGIESGFKVKELFGARRTAMDGIQGVSFCMNMPGAVRVSVVGDFNNWDGRVNPMRRIDYTDIYELFIPEELSGVRYKFEALYRDGSVDIFSDPYAAAYEPAPGNASMLTELTYKWTDDAYMKSRGEISAVNIYEVHMPTWKRGSDGNALSYVEFGKAIASYVKTMGYNYIQLMPLMEYRDDDGWGYDTTGMFAPTSRFGSPTEFMEMVNFLHGKGIGVIMDMVSVRDVDCLTYWLDTYHLDGIRLEEQELVDGFGRITDGRYSDVLVGLGWNTETAARITDYMMIPPVGRGSFADYMCGLTFDGDEKGVLAMSHDEVAYERGSYASKMSGGYEDKYANLRVLFGLFMALPGRKLTFMGQELGGFAGFDGKTAIDWSVLDFDANSYFQKYVKELNKLYAAKSALHGGNGGSVTFSETGSVVSFARCGAEDGENVYVVCNFGIEDVMDYSLEVAADGRYKELLSSDNAKFGGEGGGNKGTKTATGKVISVTAPALSFAVFGQVR